MLSSSANDGDILYVCDRKACGDVCPNPACYHTHKIEHARNFTTLRDGDWTIYVEALRPHDELTS